MQSHVKAVLALGNVIKPIELVDRNKCGTCGKNFTGSADVCTCADTD